MPKKGKTEKDVKSVQEKNKASLVGKDKQSNKKSGGVFKCLLISSAVVTLLASIAVYQVYAVVSYVPPMPKIDLNEYWGPSDKRNEVQDTSIRPYKIVFTESMQEEIRTLFELYRRNTQVTSLQNSAWTYGINSTDFAELMTEWIFQYSFRERAKFLNKFPHFRTRVQGLHLHFMRVKPELQNKNVKVYPLLLLHGWPGSIREFYETIPRLTNVRKGYDFVFEVIAPSLPGFIYSEGAARPGMSTVEIAVIMRNLMQRLGYTKYYVQGGDFGHAIGSHMATIFPNEILGFHTNFPVNFSKYANLFWVLGGLWPSLVAEGIEDRMYPITDKTAYFLEESGYLHLQSTKPDTIGIALQDSPVGLAAYIIDRFMAFTHPKNKIKSRGGLDMYFSLEKLLDNVMLYWTTRSITTAMRLYKETCANHEVQQDLAKIPTPVPTWALRMRYEPVQHSDFLLRWKYPNLVGSSNLDSGGHYAAFERPKTFADDVFKAIDSILKFKK